MNVYASELSAHYVSTRLFAIWQGVRPRGGWPVAVLVLATIGTTNPVFAGGYWNLEQGTSHYGRGGANFTNPDDPLAVMINPAGLAGQKGLKLAIGFDLVDDKRQFARAPADPSLSLPVSEFDPEVNQLSFGRLPSPNIFVSYGFSNPGWENLALGLGVWGPPRSDTRYSDDGGQRYALTRNNNAQIFFGLGAAYEFSNINLKIGATALVLNTVLDLGMSLYGGGGGIVCVRPEDPRCDVAVDLLAGDKGAPTARFGVSYQPVSWLRIAAIYQMPFNAEVDGTIEVEFGSAFRDGVASLSGDKVEISVGMPGIASLAMAYVDPDGLFDVELAAVWEGWHRNQQATIVPQGLVVSSTLNQFDGMTLGEIILENRFKDTYSVRLGGSAWVLPERLLLRAGAYYETGAVPGNYLSASTMDLDKVGGSVGAKVDVLDWLWVDIAVGYTQWLERTVENSAVTLTDILVLDAETPAYNHSIADGTYSNRQVFLMGNVGFRFAI